MESEHEDEDEIQHGEEAEIQHGEEDNGDILDWGDRSAEVGQEDEPQQSVQEEAPANRHVVPAAVVASKGTRPRADLWASHGRNFSELWPRGERKGLAMECPNCGIWRHLTTAFVRLSEEQAIRRLVAWGESCPGDPADHRGLGQTLLKDFSWADDCPVAVVF